MNEQVMTYARPVMVEVGRFTELTRITNRGGYLDGPWGAWWL